MTNFYKIILVIFIIIGIDIIINKIFRNIENHMNLPEGSWKDSCTVLSFRHPVLWAECLDDRGKTKQTSINTDNCWEYKLSNRQLNIKGGNGKKYHHIESNDKIICHIHKLRNVNGNLECE